MTANFNKVFKGDKLLRQIQPAEAILCQRATRKIKDSQAYYRSNGLKHFLGHIMEKSKSRTIYVWFRMFFRKFFG